MFTRRSVHLLALMVIMPLALLAWLGTYLYRDAERRTEATRTAILAERLAVSDHHLVRDLNEAIIHLDHLPWHEASSAQHPWITSTHPYADPEAPSPPEYQSLLNALETASSQAFDTGGHDSEPFRSLPTALPDGWTMYLHQPNFPAGSGTAAASPATHSGLLWKHLNARDEVLYWRHNPSTHWTLAKLNLTRLTQDLFAHLPPAGLPTLPGMMLITNAEKKILHKWGGMDSANHLTTETNLPLSAPLTHWRIGYITASSEFPQAMLFPITLGVTSGSVLVLALAWLFSRESDRELRVAKQRVSFVNQISHELKTPLTNIQLYTEMARDRVQKSEDTVADRQLGVVESETARLHRLIQNVLNFSRQREDRAPLVLTPLDLAGQLREIVEYWRPLLERRCFAIEVDLPDTLPAVAEPDALRQIVGNLLSNVEKYAPSGKWVRVRASAAPGNQAKVTIEDHGIGIPQGKHETIFEAFERVRSDTSEGVSGTGIGLTISRDLAVRQGGTLSADPNYAGGARFILTLPQPSHPPTPPPVL